VQTPKMILILPIAIACLAMPAGAQQLEGLGERGETKIVIRDIKRDEGGTVTLRFQMISESEKEQTIYSLLGGYLPEHVHLVDAANKKKYLPVRDASGKCLCTEIKGSVAKDKPVNLWAKFPAPPETVAKITVVVGGFEPVEGVPVSGR
jgi:hypothetical protein